MSWLAVCFPSHLCDPDKAGEKNDHSHFNGQFAFSPALPFPRKWRQLGHTKKVLPAPPSKMCRFECTSLTGESTHMVQKYRATCIKVAREDVSSHRHTNIYIATELATKFTKNYNNITAGSTQYIVKYIWTTTGGVIQVNVDDSTLTIQKCNTYKKQHKKG